MSGVFSAIFGGGGDGGAGELSRQLAMERQETQKEKQRIKDENAATEAKAEGDRQQRLRGGGYSAFTSNGYAGFGGSKSMGTDILGA